MKPDFQQLMSQAAGLVRHGQLNEAMAAIQAAMGRESRLAQADVRDDRVIIDVVAREVAPSAGKVMPPQQRQHARATETASTSGKDTGRFVAGSHSEKSGTRAYKLYIPPNHQDGVSRPLVVMLHGCTQDPDDFAVGTRMNEAACEQGFFVLYPAQAHSANSARCWNWFKHNHQQRDRGEPAILAGMTRQVISQHNIDPRQVYVAGLSAGGAMAAVMGEAYPDLFAAVGVHSGLPVGAANDMPSALAAMKGAGASPRSSSCPPIIVFHGDEDKTVHPVNGERIVSAVRPRASSVASVVRDVQGRPYTRHIHADADGRPVVEHWVIHGAGHAWSGGNKQGSYADPAGPNATKEMLRFFAAQVLMDAAC